MLYYKSKAWCLYYGESEMSKAERVLNALLNGQQLSTKQISTRYKAANPADVIYKIRNWGYDVSLNKQKTSSGTSFKYSIAV